MNVNIARLVSSMIVLMAFSCPHASEPSVLIFSKTTGFRHSSIEPGIRAVKALGKANGFKIHSTEESNAFSESNLGRFAAVIFLSTTGDVLDEPQQRAFETYIRAGGGFVGVHAAADTEYGWLWYGELVGAWFASHGDIQTATVQKVAVFGRATLPESWVRRDEWYNFKRLPTHVTAVLKLDTSSFADSSHGDHHPIAWYHDFAGGRAFYTGLGHTDASFSEAAFLAHLLDGIEYAMGRAVKRPPPRNDR